MNHKKVSEILKYYGYENEPIADVVHEETGNINESVYYVGDKYIIKSSVDPGVVKKAADLSEALGNAGLATAKMVKTLTGADHVEVDGSYFYVTTRLCGERIKTGKLYFEDQIKNARFIGEIIGRLSLALKTVDVPVNDNDLLSSVRDWAIPTLSDKLDIDGAFINRFIKRLSEMYPDLPRQIIHRDPNPGNIIVSDEVWGFIDFDLSERNVRIYDPCYAAAAILSESFEAGNEEKLAKWIHIYREIMAGFDAAAKLSDLEKEALPYIILSNQFAATAYFSEHEEYHDIFEVNVKMTGWMIDHFDALQEVSGRGLCRYL